MCGIVGYAGITGGAEGFLDLAVKKLRHRGPDDLGQWYNEDRSVGLGHTRLSVIDVSSAGHQPMRSAGGRYVLTYNGEVYNHNQLRADLHATLNGTSDTETLLAMIDSCGVTAALEKSVGMFAFAVWDNEQQVLHLVRDRVGEKPLYFMHHSGGIFFSSEPQVFPDVPGWHPEVDRDALALLLKYTYIPAPHSIYKGVSKLHPGCVLEFHAQTGETKTRRYWDIARQIEAQPTPLAFDPDAGLAGLASQLEAAIGDQMIADVPLGAFLSGGIDSSVVAMVMQSLGSKPVRTFTIGFDEPTHNEAGYARQVAELLGTDHTETMIAGDQALAVAPRLHSIYGEPFADSSQIPTYLVSESARQKVTVALTGDGGDELFGGYNRYTATPAIANVSHRLPAYARRKLAAALFAVPSHFLQRLELRLKLMEPVIGPRLSNLPDKVLKLAKILEQDNPLGVYKQLTSHWPDPQIVVKGVEGSVDDAVLSMTATLNASEQMMLLDLLTYLPDDLMCKVDRAAMHVSLETRSPFLDHRLIEYAWRMPFDAKIRDGLGKWPLRQLLYQRLPSELVDRPKMGFSVPLETWLRGPLKSWAGALLAPDRLTDEGYFDPAPIQEKWQQHQSGQRNWQNHLWSVLMFQSWQEQVL